MSPQCQLLTQILYHWIKNILCVLLVMSKIHAFLYISQRTEINEVFQPRRPVSVWWVRACGRPILRQNHMRYRSQAEWSSAPFTSFHHFMQDLPFDPKRAASRFHFPTEIQCKVNIEQAVHLFIQTEHLVNHIYAVKTHFKWAVKESQACQQPCV